MKISSQSVANLAGEMDDKGPSKETSGEDEKKCLHAYLVPT